jgi:cytoskeleton protein RodZ
MAATFPSGGFGGKLRDARERRGMSMRQIANATKISIAVLEALERNDLSRLPGGIFSRAFVRSYAIEVGLDPDAAIQEFIAQFPNGPSARGGPASEPVEDGLSVDNERRMGKTFLWLIGMSIPIAGALLYVAATGRDAARPRAASSALPAAGRLTVTLSVLRPCRVSATVDGRKRFERLLQPGDRETFDVTHEMVLTADDASAVTLTLNGAPARPLGKAGETVTARLDPANYKDYIQ